MLKGYGSPRHTALQRAASLTGVSDLVAGIEHSCALKTDATLFCWGRNNASQAGGPTGTSRVLAPTKVLAAAATDLTGVAEVAEVAAGEAHTCVRKTDSTVWCFGINNRGQYGNGEQTAEPAPEGHQRGSAVSRPNKAGERSAAFGENDHRGACAHVRGRWREQPPLLLGPKPEGQYRHCPGSFDAPLADDRLRQLSSADPMLIERRASSASIDKIHFWIATRARSSQMFR